jgi:hypothetical protein
VDDRGPQSGAVVAGDREGRRGTGHPSVTGPWAGTRGRSARSTCR